MPKGLLPPWSYEELGLHPIVNASGHMTHLGASVLTAEVMAAMRKASAHYIDMRALKQVAQQRVASLCGAQGAYFTTGAAAGLVVMTAAVVAGTDPVRIAALPHASWVPNRILIPAGHMISFGAPVEQMVRLGGGVPTPVGAVNRVSAVQLEAAIDGATAAVLYVRSHHAHQEGVLALSEALAVTQAKGVPMLVDAAAEEDLRQYVAMGVDLVAYSGGKAINGPTSGLILGRQDLIDACYAQDAGIARCMKIGKEEIVGLTAAIIAYAGQDPEERIRRRAAVVDILREGLRHVIDLRIEMEQDRFARDLWQVKVGVQKQSRMSLEELYHGLLAGPPVIVPRRYDPEAGYLVLDPRALGPEEAIVVVQRVRDLMSGAGSREKDEG